MQILTISLCHKEIGNVSSYGILVANCIAAKDFLEPVARSGSVKWTGRQTYVLALIKARSQFCLLIIETISGANLPPSFKRPIWVAARIP